MPSAFFYSTYHQIAIAEYGALFKLKFFHCKSTRSKMTPRNSVLGLGEIPEPDLICKKHDRCTSFYCSPL
jgi:hypothetical protein